MNTDAVSAAMIPSRPAWRSLLWTIPLTALWTWLIHSLPVLPESGLPALTVRLMVHTFMAIVGISAIIAASATLFSIIKYIGAAYLVYLGIRAILEKAPATFVTRGPLISAGMAFRQAILAEVLNPKTALFFLAFLPQFVRPENGSVGFQLTILGVVFVLLGFVSTLVYAVSAGRLGDFLRRNPAVLKWQGKAVGAVYCALGIRLTLERR